MYLRCAEGVYAEKRGGRAQRGERGEGRSGGLREWEKVEKGFENIEICAFLRAST